MKYLLTIYNDESGFGEATPEQISQMMEAYGAFGKEIEEAGAHLAGEGLQPTATATTVRVRDGERLVTDGPFAETKEQLGGFYLLECKDLDEAIGWARRSRAPSTGPSRCAPSWTTRPCAARARSHGGVAGLARHGSTEVVDRLFRRESGRAVATLIRVLGDFDLRRGGGPGRVRGGARAVAARRRARPTRARGSSPPRATGRSTGIRRDAPPSRKSAPCWRSCEALAAWSTESQDDELTIPDDRLRLIFTCCHPALAPEAQVALTLRTLGGLSTGEIARAFLVPGADDGAAAGAREAQDPRRGHSLPVPPDHELPDRLARCSRRSTWSSTRATPRRPATSLVRRELCGEAIRLGRVLAVADARRAGGARAARVDAAARLAARRPASDADGRARAARRAGPHALGRGADRRSAEGWSSERWHSAASGPVRAPGGDRAPHAQAPRPRHRLAQIASLYDRLAARAARRRSWS